MADKMFTAKINDEEIKKKLTELADLTSDLKPLFRVFANITMNAKIPIHNSPFTTHYFNPI